MEGDFKLDRQISATIKTRFFQLRQVAKGKPFLAQKYLENSNQPFHHVSTRLRRLL